MAIVHDSDNCLIFIDIPTIMLYELDSIEILVPLGPKTSVVRENAWLMAYNSPIS